MKKRHAVKATRLTPVEEAKLQMIREEGGFDNDSDAIRWCLDVGFYFIQAPPAPSHMGG